MRHLYELLNNRAIEGLLHYRDYIRINEKVLDTISYREHFKDNQAVSYICDLQDSAIGIE